MKPYRWKAVVSYKPENMVDITIEFEELYELHEYIERGSDWNLIDAITITLNKL